MNFLVNRKITISMLFIALSLLGYVSYKQLPVELMPNAELPNMYIRVSSSQDMDPAYVESGVIIPLEGAINAIGGVDNMQSTVDSRNSTIRIDFKKNINFKITYLKLQEKINEVATTLPDGFNVSVQKIDLARMSNAFMALQIRGSGGVDRVRSIVDKEITSELENIDGIAGVSVYGGREKAIEIQLDPDICKALNLTPAQISGFLSQNTQEKAFIGYVNEPDKKYFVDVSSPFTKVSDLENLVVAPGPILLKDIAVIFFDLKEETSYSRVNGKDAISVSLMNDSQANLIDLSHRAIQAVDKLNERLAPLDVEIIVQENSAETMEKNIDQIIGLALIGGLLAVLILWVFLKNIRLVTIIALSIPISVYTAFNIFYAFGITINSLTLIGIALAVGMLLDNSVVVLENIYRLSGGGMPAKQAVTQGTKEVSRSIFAASLTTITVFLPFVFSDNFLIKLLGHHIGIAIISTLLISLLVALLFIPMATYSLLKRKNSGSVFYEKVMVTQRSVQIYLTLLKTCMRNPGVTILGAIVALFVTLFLALSMNTQQNTEVESDRFNIRVTTPTGSTLESTDKVVRLMEERLEDFPEKKELICLIQEKEALLTMILKKDYQKTSKRNISDIRADVSKLVSKINGAETDVSDVFSGNSNSDPMAGMARFMSILGVGNNRERIVIKGSDYDMMQLVGEDLRYYLSEQNFIRNSNVSYTSRQPELRLTFDPILLLTYNVSRSNISSGIASLNNDIASGSTFKVGEDIYDIIIRNQIPKEDEDKTEEERAAKMKSVDDLKATMIQNSNGGLHQLQDLSTLNYGFSRSQIKRVNQDKQIEVYYNFSRDIESSKSLLEGYRADIDQLVADYNLPAGIAVQVFHQEDQFSDFKFLFLAAFILIFMIMAAVFESITTPFVLLISIPLAAIGSLMALLFTGNSLLNANTLTGFLILLGVVVNNGIILIDYSNILRTRGYRRNRALMVAGLSRVRPILITSITTIVAMFPLAMGNSEYSGVIGAPFAITVIGGLAFSTMLTLLLVPTACMGLENTLKWYKTLPLKTWIIHAIILVTGFVCIYLYVDEFLWQSLYLIGLVVLIPGMTYFAQNSLRRAKSEIIASDVPIQIIIRNLVKIYDRPERFNRQWQSGLKIRERLGISNQYHQLKDFVDILWQFALFGFCIYFTFFFISNRLWIFFLAMAIYAFALHLWGTIRQYLYYKFGKKKWLKILKHTVFWLIPLSILAALFAKMNNPNLIVTLGFFWILCLIIYLTSKYLYSNKINIERIKGRFTGFRRSYFNMVKNIPLIGKQRKPFKALRGISIEINTGMFGLLGPNGAGKSTLMRIVCGILEQSYGSIWINGLDTRIHREELQSIIGFLPQEFGTYENMSAWEFLDYQAILKGITTKDIRNERLEYVLKSVHMYERKNDKIGSFSGGMKQRIGIALILLNLPRILIVDEPTAGLDPRERIRFRNLLVELSKDRVVIFSTHIIEDISSSCNQVAVVDKGSLKYFGNPVNMVDMANGKIWKFNIGKDEFESVLDKSKVVHHIQDEDTIQVRYLASEQPYKDAVLVEPNLEDAYLCLLKEM
jgi:multidrug efflux pump subunit AcrB/ABC-type multidrug transport system ATPase subunit